MRAATCPPIATVGDDLSKVRRTSCQPFCRPIAGHQTLQPHSQSLEYVKYREVPGHHSEFYSYIPSHTADDDPQSQSTEAFQPQNAISFQMFKNSRTIASPGSLVLLFLWARSPHIVSLDGFCHACHAMNAWSIFVEPQRRSSQRAGEPLGKTEQESKVEGNAKRT